MSWTVHSRSVLWSVLTHCQTLVQTLRHLSDGSPYLTLFIYLFIYLPYLQCWAGYCTCPPLRPYQFGSMHNPEGHSKRHRSQRRRWSWKCTSHLALVTCSMVVLTIWSAHRSIYKYLDTGLPSLSLANAIGDPFKLTSPVQHASRWRMRGSQTCRLLHRPRGLARMRHRENRRDREFMLGNSRMKLPDAMPAG